MGSCVMVGDGATRRSHDGRGVAAEEERANDLRQSKKSCEVKDEERVGYIMGLARIIFNKSNKTLWYITLSVV